MKRKLIWSSRLSARLDKIQQNLERAKNPTAKLWWKFRKFQLEKRIGV